MFRLPTLCCKLLYNLTPPHHLLRVILSGLVEMLSPRPEVLKNSHQIKHSSELLGCDYFLSWQKPQEPNEILIRKIIKSSFLWHQLAVSTNIHPHTYILEIFPPQVIKLSEQRRFFFLCFKRSSLTPWTICPPRMACPLRVTEGIIPPQPCAQHRQESRWKSSQNKPITLGNPSNSGLLGVGRVLGTRIPSH